MGLAPVPFSPIFASTNNHKLSKNVSLSFVEKYRSIGQNQPLALAIKISHLLWHLIGPSATFGGKKLKNSDNLS